MVRPAAPERETAITMIRHYAEEHGIKEGVRLAREEFPNIPAASWARWRQKAIGSIREGGNEIPSKLSTEIRAVIPTPDQLITSTADPVPALKNALRFWSALDELESDVQLMRNFALTKGSDGRPKVRVPSALRDAHKMRSDLLKFALQHAETAFGVERMSRLFEAVIEEVGSESSDCQRRITARLAELQTENERRGF